MPSRFRLLLGAAAACAALAGCGDDAERPAQPTVAGTADERAVEEALSRYAAAVRAGDGRTICSELLAPEVLVKVRLAGGDCERDLIADRIEEGGPDYRLEVRSIEVRGDRATARTRSLEADGPRAVVQPLVRVRGEWRLSS
jgi:hypothetical protein